MSDALKRLSARVTDLVARAETGQPIDWQRVRLVNDLDMVAAGVEFAVDAVERTKQADEEHNQRQSLADSQIGG